MKKISAYISNILLLAATILSIEGCYNWDLNDIIAPGYYVCQINSSGDCVEFIDPEWTRSDAEYTCNIEISQTNAFSEHDYCSKTNCVGTCLATPPGTVNPYLIKLYYYSPDTGAQADCETGMGGTFSTSCD